MRSINCSAIRILPLFLFAILSLAQAPVSDGYFPGADYNAMYYRLVGSGAETVVFIHGGPGFDMNDGGLELDALAFNRRLISYDQRGGGFSEAIDDPALLSLDRHVEDLEALRQYFGIDKLILIGNSWGSAIAQLYVSTYPQNVERIVFLSPISIRETIWNYRVQQVNKHLNLDDLNRLIEILSIDFFSISNEEVISLCQEYIPIILGPYFTSATDLSNMNGDYCGSSPDGMRRRFLLSGAIFASFAAWDWRTLATEVNVPTLVIDGEWTSVPKSSTREWAYYLLQSRVYFLPDSGHLTFVDNPERLVHVLDRFIKGHYPKQARPVGRVALDLLAHYRFSGDTLNHSDNAQDAIIEGSVDFVKDRRGHKDRAIAFSPGALARVENPGWIPSQKKWSWSAWVWSKNNHSSTLLEEGAGRLWLDHGKPSFTLGGLTLQATNRLEQKEWHHLAIVREDNQLRLYQDGVLVDELSSANLADLSGDFTMQNANGRLDDVRIYARSLGSCDIGELIE